MDILKKTLEENASYYEEIKKETISRLACLPKGSIKKKIINGKNYYYFQYRDGNKIIQNYLGKKIPEEIIENLKERKLLERELKNVEKALKLLKSKKEIDTLQPLREIIHALAKTGLWEESVELIGSWVFLLYQQYFGIEKFPLRTDDLDFAIQIPYRGKEINLSEILKKMGFKEGFYPDGSMYFYRPGLRVEFLVPKRGKSKEKAIQIKKLSLSAQPLRFLEILLENPVEIKVSRKVKFKIPSLSSFLIHKLIVFQKRKEKEDALKDLKQAVIVAKKVVSDPEERKKLREIWDSIPEGWGKKVKKGLKIAKEMLPLEKEIILFLEKLFNSFTLQI